MTKTIKKIRYENAKNVWLNAVSGSKKKNNSKFENLYLALEKATLKENIQIIDESNESRVLKRTTKIAFEIDDVEYIIKKEVFTEPCEESHNELRYEANGKEYFIWNFVRKAFGDDSKEAFHLVREILFAAISEIEKTKFVELIPMRHAQ